MANTPETAELITYLTSLLESTRAGKVNWGKTNPSTFLWNTPSPKNANVGLQKVPKQGGSISYNFSVVDGNVQKLVVEGEPPEVNRLLGELFEAVETSITRKGLDFLKSILPA